ncbi:MAG: NFACT RNA binding domain-containing protein [Candidatus Micrarchaeota archaeon]
MKLEIDLTKSANENAQLQYRLSKDAKRRKENLEKEMAKTQREIQREKNRLKFATKEEKEEHKKKVRILEQREWYQKFHNFLTSEMLLAIGGRDAQQNDLLFSKYLEDGDLFFHADVHGASAVILKNGKSASEQSLKEAAQFAACNSSAWKGGLHVANVYWVDKAHVEKYSQGEYVPKGGFMIRGEKKWLKNAELKLVIAIERTNNVERLAIVPSNYDFLKSPRAFIRKILVQPGPVEKKEVAKSLVSRLKAESIDLAFDQLMQMLPGNSEIVEK